MIDNPTNPTEPKQAHWAAKTNWEEVNEMRKLYAADELTLEQMADKYELGVAAVTKIIYNDSWFDEEYTPPKSATGHDIVIHEMRARFINGELTRKQISAEYNRNYQSVCQIINNSVHCDPQYQVLLDKKIDDDRRNNVKRRNTRKQRNIKVTKTIGTNARFAGKTNWKEVKEMRRLYASGNITQTELGIKYNLSPPAVGGIIHNETWYDENYTPPLKASLCCQKTAKRIRTDFVKKEMTRKQLSIKYGKNYQTICKIINNDCGYNAEYQDYLDQHEVEHTPETKIGLMMAVHQLLTDTALLQEDFDTMVAMAKNHTAVDIANHFGLALADITNILSLLGCDVEYV